jgi:predicted DNA-binding mobile mystery protein A
MGLARHQLDRRFSSLRREELFTLPSGSWVRLIREALGMTSTHLARRLGVSQPRVPRLEKAERDGSITLASLRKAAEAMDCALVYAFVPNKPLEDMVRERAGQVADQLLARTHHSMKLENQPLLQGDLKRERDRLLAELLKGNPRRLWDDQ